MRYVYVLAAVLSLAAISTAHAQAPFGPQTPPGARSGAPAGAYPGGSHPSITIDPSGARVGGGSGSRTPVIGSILDCIGRTRLKPDSLRGQTLRKNTAYQSAVAQPAMREPGMRCEDDPASECWVASSPTRAATPVAAAIYVGALPARRKVSDRDYGSCMVKARELQL